MLEFREVRLSTIVILEANEAKGVGREMAHRQSN